MDYLLILKRFNGNVTMFLVREKNWRCMCFFCVVKKKKNIFLHGPPFKGLEFLQFRGVNS